jgi:uncharacterized protein (DUF488 family)
MPAADRNRYDVFSVGHGTASRDELLARLGQAEVRSLVDIRTAPGSRRHPHLSRESLEQWLPEAGVGYRWDPRLGGFRKPAADSLDVVWRNDSFRGYAGHLRSRDALDALAELAAEARGTATAYMCSETVWWRCHRRLVSDALELLHDLRVGHLMPNRITPHRVTEGVRVDGAVLVYDAGAGASPP